MPKRRPSRWRNRPLISDGRMLCGIVIDPGSSNLNAGAGIYWPYEAEAWEEV